MKGQTYEMQWKRKCVCEREWHYRQGEGRDYATICEWENKIK